MSPKAGKNIAESVRQRLLNMAKKDTRPFNELLQYYAMERFLYRLSRSSYSGCFILKGALMLRVWRSSLIRSTLDIDMLGITNNETAKIEKQIHDILMVEVEPDGMFFNTETIRSERITEDADYEGIRIKFVGLLGSARVTMRLDIGFGDIVFPGPEEIDFPTLMDSPVPKLMGYSRESAIAEKFEAMVKLGEINSRLKDFYDIWLLSRNFDFEGEKLAEAIRLTFERRGSELPKKIVPFTSEFIAGKHLQWNAFCKRLNQDHLPIKFEEIVLSLKDFLYPIVMNINSGLPNSMKWKAPGPWF